MRLVSIVVAGGRGVRLGADVPKQLLPVAGRSILAWSVDAVARVADGVVVVAPADDVERHAPTGGTAVVTVAGGNTRSASVRAGLEAATDLAASHVLVHDAARPCVTAAVVDRVVAGLMEGHVAVVPVVPVTDTLRHVDGYTVDRSPLRAVQTPQGFDLDVLRSAHASGDDGTDDASLVDAMGIPVHLVDGDASNLKVTVAADLRIAEILLR